MLRVQVRSIKNFNCSISSRFVSSDLIHTEELAERHESVEHISPSDLSKANSGKVKEAPLKKVKTEHQFEVEEAPLEEIKTEHQFVSSLCLSVFCFFSFLFSQAMIFYIITDARGRRS
jgi:hypothetical protein